MSRSGQTEVDTIGYGKLNKTAKSLSRMQKFEMPSSPMNNGTGSLAVV